MMTPLLRWRNYNLTNLTELLNGIKPHINTVISDANLKNAVDRNHPRLKYARTSAQSAKQLGLINIQNPNQVEFNKYLFDFDANMLSLYLEFWSTIYYAPNPYVASIDEPVMIYVEYVKYLLEGNQISITDFCQLKSWNNEDIIKNTFKDTKFFKSGLVTPIAYSDRYTVTPGQESILINFIKTIERLFPIPVKYKHKSIFFNRYSIFNFHLFFSIDINKDEEVDSFVVDFSDRTLAFNGNNPNFNKNRLIYGAPGTGKSFLLDNDSSVDFDNTIRTTFYSNYTSNQFIGSYKPVTSNNLDISYEFVPGPMIEILKDAYLDLSSDFNKNFVLIIEEINRASSPAGTFGEFFQLLDRDSDGYSQYSINLTPDLKQYFEKNNIIIENENLFLPPNLYIWATMNSADQGVNYIDTAFFRRWDPEYININNSDTEINTFNVNINGYGSVNWNSFRKDINKELLSLGIREDKLIGTFFIQQDTLRDPNLFEKNFKDKLLRYLYEDALKHYRNEFFSEDFTSFSSLLERYDRNVTKIFKNII